MDVKQTPDGFHYGAAPAPDAIAVPAADAGSRPSVPHRSRQMACLTDYFTKDFNASDALRVRASDRNRLCLEVDPRLGAGRLDLLEFHNGLTLGSADYAFSNALEEFSPAPGPQVRFYMMLDGRFDLTVPDLGVRDHVAAGHVWLRARDIGAMRTRVAAGVRMRGLSIDVPPTMAEEWRAQGPRTLNAAIGGILDDTGPVFARVPAVNGHSLAIANALVDTDTETVCGRLHAESLALDLLARLLAPDATTDTIAGIGGRSRRHREVALDEAMDILRAEWMDPPTIARLARRVGLNECYLKSDFRERFGTTIAGCVRALRMTAARRLIERDGLSVQQAAQAVGYANAGHFAAAFRRVHGCPPSRFGARRAGR